ncbi:MAG: DUF5606 domain-containing protein [Bacteroidales bacterium]|nr:DUF5606 domain-containing protein [Bacteroidales bacterium]
MDLKDIMAISGQQGLFKLISQGRNAIIVENLETKKRISAFSTMKVSSLEEIAIFTKEEDVPLVDIFKKIHEKENGGPAIDFKSPNEELKRYFEEVLPGYDKARVYVSDMKKIINWYNLLQKLGMVHFEAEKKEPSEKEEIKSTKDKPAEPAKE